MSGIIWTNTTKASGGLPFLENDVYNTLGFEIMGWNGSYATYSAKNNSSIGAGNGWRYSLAIADIASARSKNTDNNAYSIKSQTIEVIRPEDHVDSAWESGDYLYSWPSKNQNYVDNDFYRINKLSLFAQVINATSQYTAFPLTAIELYNSSGYGYYHETLKPMVKTWAYTGNPGGSLSDCGCIYIWDEYIPPGKTAEFDIIAHTDWGLLDTSEARLHVKITAPPDPACMTEDELKANGIKKQMLYNGLINPQYAIQNTTTGVTEINITPQGYGDYALYSIGPASIEIQVT